MKKLYVTKEEPPRYGHILATNSAGKFVMELRGSDEVITIGKDMVEAVMPYTVDVTFISSSPAGQSYAFFSKAGDLAVDDIMYLFEHNQFVRVRKVDSRSEKATKWIDGILLPRGTVISGETA
jgi:hypothetical protein